MIVACSCEALIAQMDKGGKSKLLEESKADSDFIYAAVNTESLADLGHCIWDKNEPSCSCAF